MLDLDYDVKQWYARVQGLEFEAERGARCTGWHANTIILHFTPFLSFLFLTYFLSFYLPSVCTVDLPYRIQLVSIHYTMLWRMPWRGTAEMSYCNIVHCSISCKSCFAVICHAKVYYRVPCGTTQCSVLTLYHNKNHHTDAHTNNTYVHTYTHALPYSLTPTSPYTHYLTISECFDMRMERTALYAIENGFRYFTTTNATSRWKDVKQVNESGIKGTRSFLITVIF